MTRRALAIDALGNVEADMVERVARAIDSAPFEPCAQAKAALEASHHAELVEALERVTALESHNPSVATADDLLRTAKRIARAALTQARGDTQ